MNFSNFNLNNTSCCSTSCTSSSSCCSGSGSGGSSSKSFNSNLALLSASSTINRTSCNNSKFSGKNYRNLDPTKRDLLNKRNSTILFTNESATTSYGMQRQPYHHHHQQQQQQQEQNQDTSKSKLLGSNYSINTKVSTMNLLASFTSLTPSISMTPNLTSTPKIYGKQHKQQLPQQNNSTCIGSRLLSSVNSFSNLRKSLKSLIDINSSNTNLSNPQQTINNNNSNTSNNESTTYLSAQKLTSSKSKFTSKPILTSLMPNTSSAGFHNRNKELLKANPNIKCFTTICSNDRLNDLKDDDECYYYTNVNKSNMSINFSNNNGEFINNNQNNGNEQNSNKENNIQFKKKFQSNSKNQTPLNNNKQNFKQQHKILNKSIKKCDSSLFLWPFVNTNSISISSSNSTSNNNISKNTNDLNPYNSKRISTSTFDIQLNLQRLNKNLELSSTTTLGESTINSLTDEQFDEEQTLLDRTYYNSNDDDDYIQNIENSIKLKQSIIDLNLVNQTQNLIDSLNKSLLQQNEAQSTKAINDSELFKRNNKPPPSTNLNKKNQSTTNFESYNLNLSHVKLNNNVNKKESTLTLNKTDESSITPISQTESNLNSINNLQDVTNLNDSFYENNTTKFNPIKLSQPSNNDKSAEIINNENILVEMGQKISKFQSLIDNVGSHQSSTNYLDNNNSNNNSTGNTNNGSLSPNSSLVASTSFFDYNNLNKNANNRNNFALLKYSLSFPASFELADAIQLDNNNLKNTNKLLNSDEKSIYDNRNSHKTNSSSFSSSSSSSAASTSTTSPTTPASPPPPTTTTASNSNETNNLTQITTTNLDDNISSIENLLLSDRSTSIKNLEHKKRYSASSTLSSVSSTVNSNNKEDTCFNESIKSDENLNSYSSSTTRSSSSTINRNSRQLSQSAKYNINDTSSSNSSSITSELAKKTRSNRTSFKQRLIRINKRWSISKFNKNYDETSDLNNNSSNKINNNNHNHHPRSKTYSSPSHTPFKENDEFSSGNFIREIDEQNSNNLQDSNSNINNNNKSSASSTSSASSSSSAGYLYKSDLYLDKNSNRFTGVDDHQTSGQLDDENSLRKPEEEEGGESLVLYRDKFESRLSSFSSSSSSSSTSSPLSSSSPKQIYKKKLLNRSNSLNSSTRSISGKQSSLSDLVIGKAIVIKEFTPSPYDKNSLSLKIGDQIDVIDMNETGIWTGILNKKLGTFKFIYVKILEIFDPKEKDLSTKSLNKKKIEIGINTNINNNNNVNNNNYIINKSTSNLNINTNATTTTTTTSTDTTNSIKIKKLKKSKSLDEKLNKSFEINSKSPPLTTTRFKRRQSNTLPLVKANVSSSTFKLLYEKTKSSTRTSVSTTSQRCLSNNSNCFDLVSKQQQNNEIENNSFKINNNNNNTSSNTSSTNNNNNNNSNNQSSSISFLSNSASISASSSNSSSSFIVNTITKSDNKDDDNDEQQQQQQKNLNTDQYQTTKSIAKSKYGSISDYLNLIDNLDIDFHKVYVNLFHNNNIHTCNDLIKLSKDYLETNLEINNQKHLEQIEIIKTILLNNNKNQTNLVVVELEPEIEEIEVKIKEEEEQEEEIEIEEELEISNYDNLIGQEQQHQQYQQRLVEQQDQLATTTTNKYNHSSPSPSTSSSSSSTSTSSTSSINSICSIKKKKFYSSDPNQFQQTVIINKSTESLSSTEESLSNYNEENSAINGIFAWKKSYDSETALATINKNYLNNCRDIEQTVTFRFNNNNNSNTSNNNNNNNRKDIMGQKNSKSDNLIEKFDPKLLITATSSSSSSSSSSGSSSSSSASSTTSTSSSKSKSNHDSAISNDSGCYSAENVDRYSSPSGSSVLCLFDLTTTKANTPTINNLDKPKAFKPQTHHLHNKSTNSEQTLKKLNKPTQIKFKKTSKSKSAYKLETTGSVATVIDTKIRKDAKHRLSNNNNDKLTKLTTDKQITTIINRNSSSICDSLVCSLSSFSNSELFGNEDSQKPLRKNSNLINQKSIIDESNELINDDCNKKAQLLCDQLNQILNISTSLAAESMAALQENSNEPPPTQTLAKKNKCVFINVNDLSNNQQSTSNLTNKKKHKTLNLTSNNDATKPTTNLKTISTRQQLQSNSSVNNSISDNCNNNTKLVNRSHTFHANNNNNNNLSSVSCRKINEENNEDLVECSSSVHLDNDDINTLNDFVDSKKFTNTRKLSQYFLKNGRRLLTWNKKFQNSNNNNDLNTTNNNNNNCHRNLNSSNQMNNKSNKLNSYFLNKNNSKCINSKSQEQIINLIAAKLLSENIELAKSPYTDEMGFCKIPKALVKRYACELNQDIEVISKCIETERLNQLDKLGKLGIPNDFLYSSCKCTKLCLNNNNNNNSSNLSNTNVQSTKSNDNKKESNLWQACKCDLDTRSVDLFFTKLGLPMYAENLRNNKNLFVDSIRVLFEMNPQQLETSCAIENKTHLKIILSAIQKAKLLIN